MQRRNESLAIKKIFWLTSVFLVLIYVLGHIAGPGFSSSLSNHFSNKSSSSSEFLMGLLLFFEETVNNSRPVLSLEVTQEQREAIYHFFANNDWEFKDISGENASVEKNESNEGDFFIAHDENSDECPNCLCRQSITNERNRQLWWENENHPEHERNAYLRKDKYKRFGPICYIGEFGKTLGTYCERERHSEEILEDINVYIIAGI
ncbi:unnamed protein product [Mytilus coruscus]|uniref:Uncharacterized protein n=1 Tax=Mytilus coruscus TaxID=42192 RepID=A0A6J8F1C8_MYTCO|nr:unnamed protein product [Mytilus coruscus]